jgi:hypothetical protein
MGFAHTGEVGIDSAHSRDSTRGISHALVVSLVLAVGSIVLPGAAQAIDRSLCKDDNVTEVPDFAQGRDSSQCLMIDPGNGDPPVPFQYEFFHLVGLEEGGKDSGESARWDRWIDAQIKDYGNCRTVPGQFCSLLFWDTTFDNYLSQVAANEDIVHLGGEGYEYLYFKNSQILNGWKCGGGNWTGPNGISCSSSSAAHSDGIQFRGTIANDGWLIFQDSALVNGHTDLMRLQLKETPYTAHGNLLLQGFHLGTVNTPIGESRTWIDDCRARGSDTKCVEPIAVGTMPLEEIWYVDVWGNAGTKLGRDGFTKKVVIVNTGCGTNGCGGSIQFKHGWPHPIDRSDPSGPGVCPNGYIGNQCQGDSDVACFCYTSLEAALDDQPTNSSKIGDCPAGMCPHKAPPFIHLSSAGWENPPPTAPKPRPAPPLLLPEE